MNSVIQIGRLTRDVELRTMTSKSGEAFVIGKFTLAIPREGKKDQTDFIDCTIYGKSAEALAKYTKKGAKICTMGSVLTDTFEVEGKRRKSTYVLVKNFEFLDSKKSEQTEEPAEENTIPSGFNTLTEEDIPF